MVELSDRVLKIIVKKSARGANGKGGKHAWKDGGFQENHRNYTKEPNWNS